MFTRVVFLATILCLGSASVWAEEGLDKMFTDQKLFGMSIKEFGKAYGVPLRFQWTNKERTVARRYGRQSVFGVTAVEILVTFKEGEVTEAYASIYNRGDMGLITEQLFDKLEKSTIDNLTKVTRSKVNKRTSSGSNDAPSYFWHNSRLVYRLDALKSSRRNGRDTVVIPEYIRLRVFPYERDKSMSSYGRVKRLVRSMSIRDKVVKKDNGDVYIDGIPMVDQGQKGYCACATTARVLQHYGREIDQHEIARIAFSDSRIGTSGPALIDALKRLKTKLNLKLTIYENMDTRWVKSVISAYDRKAKKHQKPEVRLSAGITLDQIFYQMDPDVLKEAVATRSKVDKFARTISDNTSRGVPLVWSVLLGIVKEKEIPQARGGHMRLIIGYNKKTKEIIYSDSWGARHAFKRMPVDDAYIITFGLFALKGN